jgi:hypothetical protein
MIDALIKLVSVTYKCYEMDAILLSFDVAYGVCRIVIKSVQQCRYFLFFVNLLLVCVNYGQRTMQVCS